MNTNASTTELSVVEAPLTTTDLVMDNQAVAQMMSVAALMAQSRVTVPNHLRGSEADCLAIVMQAAQWRMNPFAVAQKTHLVNGNLGYEAQLINAVISSSRAISGRFRYEYKEWSSTNGKIRCGAVLAGDADITWGEWLDTKTVTTRNSPLWKTNPKQQAAYLAVKYWSRLYCPDVILGVYTADEYQDSDIQQRPAYIASAEAASHEPEARAPSLDAVIEAINSASTESSLLDVVGRANELSSPDQITARKAYRVRLSALRKSTESPREPTQPEPQETGEITAAFIIGQLKQATTQTHYDDAMDLARELTEEDMAQVQPIADSVLEELF